MREVSEWVDRGVRGGMREEGREGGKAHRYSIPRMISTPCRGSVIKWCLLLRTREGRT